MRNTTTVEQEHESSIPWALVPSIERSFINSEQPADQERALAYCQAHGLDYGETRRLIIAEMAREYDANEPAREKRRATRPVGRSKGYHA